MLFASRRVEAEIESSAEEINIIRAQRSVFCNEEHALLYKESVCSISTSQSNVFSHPLPSHWTTTCILPRVSVFSWTLCSSHIMCELIQRGRTAKIWLDPRGEQVARKGRKNGGRRRERERERKELRTWGKLMNGRYYMEGKMRGRTNLMRGSLGRDSISNGFYPAPAPLQTGVGDVIIPMAF